MAENDDYYGQITFDEPRRPLNVPALLSSGAMRVTYPGDGKGGYEKIEHPEQFSVVSGINDSAQGSVTPNWPNKPQSYQLAEKYINAPVVQGQDHLIYDGKYRQIIDSARNMGLSDNDIFNVPRTRQSRLQIGNKRY